MPSSRCVECNDGLGAKARDGLCTWCWNVRQPTVEGLTIHEMREALDVSINHAARAVGLDPKRYIDDVEFALDVAPDFAGRLPHLRPGTAFLTL